MHGFAAATYNIRVQLAKDLCIVSEAILIRGLYAMPGTYEQYIQHHLLRLRHPEIVDFGHTPLDIFHDLRS
jgi:hypothetical protein